MVTAAASLTVGGRLLARQPIFDRKQRCVAYELLARESAANVYCATDPDAATRRTVDIALNLGGFLELTNRRRAFINFTADLLVQDFASVMPPATTVIEVLETVDPTPEVVAACRRLKAQGYKLALDDFVDRADYAPLTQLADIIKVDFLSSSPADRAAASTRFAGTPVELLAEKLETIAEFEEAAALGYRYFQGYFFCEPQMVERREVPVAKQAYLRFLQEVSAQPLDFDRVEAVVKSEVGLSLRLLNYLNSSAMGLRQRVTSIKHALILLGQEPLRRWGAAFAAAALADGKPEELVRICLVRGRCAELLATPAGMEDESFAAFLTGLLSSLDVMLDRPMGDLLRSMPLASDVKAALTEGGGRLGILRRLIVNYERAQWEGVEVEGAALVPRHVSIVG